jgi:hypothetical protein
MFFFVFIHPLHKCKGKCNFNSTLPLLYAIACQFSPERAEPSKGFSWMAAKLLNKKTLSKKDT